MTCVAAIVEKGEVWVGGDSAGVSHNDLYLELRRDPKVFQVGPFLLGYTSSFRMGQVLRFGDAGKALGEKCFLCGCEEMDAYEIMVTKLVPRVREMLKSAGYARKENEHESGGCFVVGFSGRLFKVEGDYQVGEPLDPFSAVGCGADLALGSLHATEPENLGRGKTGLLPTFRIQKALEAAQRFSAGVRGPFTILKLEAAS